MMNETRERVRAVAMALPEATEDFEGVGSPAYKVRGKIFAMWHPHQDRPSVWVKAPRGTQEVLVGAEPERFFAPPYVGQHGWVGFWMDDDVDWGVIEDLIEDSYRMTAPKRLSKKINPV